MEIQVLNIQPAISAWSANAKHYHIDKSKVLDPVENTYVISADETYISSTLPEIEYVASSHFLTSLIIFGLQDSSLLCHDQMSLKSRSSRNQFHIHLIGNSQIYALH